MERQKNIALLPDSRYIYIRCAGVTTNKQKKKKKRLLYNSDGQQPLTCYGCGRRLLVGCSQSCCCGPIQTPLPYDTSTSTFHNYKGDKLVPTVTSACMAQHDSSIASGGNRHSGRPVAVCPISGAFCTQPICVCTSVRPSGETVHYPTKRPRQSCVKSQSLNKTSCMGPQGIHIPVTYNLGNLSGGVASPPAQGLPDLNRARSCGTYALTIPHSVTYCCYVFCYMVYFLK